MNAPPIHSTALVPVEFIPDNQDADRLKRERVASLRASEQANERQRATLKERYESREIENPEYRTSLEDCYSADARIRDEYEQLERDLEMLREAYPTPQRFLILVPTSVERDQINSRLIALGLMQVTQEMIRATMIEELFHQDWTQPGEEKIDASENEARAEEIANFLDGVWLRQSAHDLAITRWEEQEQERVLDQMNGAPPSERAELPPKIITVRENARMQVLIDRMMTQSQRLRDLAAANTDFGRRNAVLLVRMHVVGINFDVGVPIERDKRTRALSEEAANALRETVDDVSWNKLVAHIDRLYLLDEAERKNSVSLPEKPPLPNGSIEPSAGPGSNGGSSTDSSSAPPPAVASETITGTSFGSTSDFDPARAMLAQSDSPTAAA